MNGNGDAPWAPKVGDQARVVIWTDVYPSTVVKVSPSGHMIELQQDSAAADPEGTEWMQGGFAPVRAKQKWIITRNEDGGKIKATFRKAVGKWKVSGSRLRESGMWVGPGWLRYEDPNF